MAYVLASALAFRVLMDMLFKLSVKNVAFNSIGDFFTLVLESDNLGVVFGRHYSIRNQLFCG